jgi:hypothetical protein
MTGASTSPATTPGSTPSIPAATMSTSARHETSSLSGSINRWRPATPTSKMMRVSTPAASSTIRASSATARSEVPAVMIAARPPDTSGAKPFLRTDAELGPKRSS